jgi:hypothetical protein
MYFNTENISIVVSKKSEEIIFFDLPTYKGTFRTVNSEFFSFVAQKYEKN